MSVYDDVTGEIILNPDLSSGYVYDGVIVKSYTEPMVEVVSSTVTKERPKGLRRIVPGRPITEACQWYHKKEMVGSVEQY